jgi:hypothetical protein
MARTDRGENQRMGSQLRRISKSKMSKPSKRHHNPIVAHFTKADHSRPLCSATLPRGARWMREYDRGWPAVRDCKNCVQIADREGWSYGKPPLQQAENAQSWARAEGKRAKQVADDRYGADTSRNGPVRVAQVEPSPEPPVGSIAQRGRRLAHGAQR